ncbi:MAG: adenylate/guanylate cyclase domain-containing protein [Treponema sp.]|nr:adenylate/guanylate cyclase domain-containing protein [Treponema sp.]
MAFSRYLSPVIVSEIIANPSTLKLGGEEREMTVIFTDIRGFSSISEQLEDPKLLVDLLNRYLTAMSNIIMENLGTIDKYEGDAIIAFFGAPFFHKDHAALACLSALKIKLEEEELNKKIPDDPKADPKLKKAIKDKGLFTRIGINTGKMVVGNMGAKNKMDYTVMGNAVNLASRLEGVNKFFHTGILISEDTKTKIENKFICRTLNRVKVVGIDTPVRPYELLDLWHEMDTRQTEDLANWEEAIKLFENRDFEKAEELFSGLLNQNPKDETVKLYAEWCRKYISSPPPAEWDGIINLTEK